MEIDTDVNIAKKVYKKINDLLGEDMNDEVCNKLRVELKCRKEELEQMVTSVRNEMPIKLLAAITDVNEVSQRLLDLTLDYDNLKKEVLQKQSDIEPIYEKLNEYKNKMNDMQNSLHYLQMLKYTEDISEEMRTSLSENDDESCIQKYKLICSLLSNLSESPCFHLSSYVKSVIVYWNNILKDKFIEQYEDLLKAIKWPFISVGYNVVEPPPDNLKSAFQETTKVLLRIQLQIQLFPDNDSLYLPLSLPIAVLIKPLQKRFLYHFCGKKATNRSDKPEWAFLQLLTWIKDHEHFLDKWVQPVFDEFAELPSNFAKLEFIRGFVKMATDKLKSDLSQLLHSDNLIAHTIDETLSFQRELIKVYNYPTSSPSVLAVLTQAQIFQKWINMEKKFAKERMDDILSDKKVWDILFENDKLKITECGDLFVTMLVAINDRYSLLPQPGHRLQFLEVQLELIDDFRLRLLQLLHEERNDPLNSKLSSILNTVHYLVMILTEWGNSTRFIMLLHYKNQLDMNNCESKHSTSVFEEIVYLLNRIVEDLSNILCETIMSDVRAKSRSYRNDRWFAMPCWNTIIFPTLTPSGCPMFQVLANSLHCLHNKLAPDIFKKCWEMIATQLTKMILEEVILQNTFNDGGAQQLHFDVRRNLLALFSHYTPKPEAYFLPLLEACSLLCLDKSIGINYLPMNIMHLRKDHVVSILDRRTGWRSTPVVD